MGRIVINETENKQTVILNDRASGVTGGYFDSGMNWHEFGGGGDFPLLKMKAGKGFSGSEIVDNELRLMCGPIKLSQNGESVLCIPEGYVAICKPCDVNGENIGDTFIFLPSPLLNSNITNASPYWTKNTLSVSSAIPATLGGTGSTKTLEAVDPVPEYCYISLKKGLEGTDPVNAQDVDGYCCFDGVWYHMVGE